MKKKFFTRFALICLSLFCTLSMTGCFGYGDGDEPTHYSGLDMVKTLYRKSDYNFAESVGEGGHHDYYNAYSYFLLEHLYSIYANSNYDAVKKQEIIDGTAYSDNIYVYDTIRYAITSYQLSGYEITLTADVNKAWKFSLQWDSSLYPSYLSDSGSESIIVSDSDLIQDSFNGFYSANNYLDAFAGSDSNEDGVYEGELVNALEYSIYKIVLGYDLESIANEITFTYEDGLPIASINGESSENALLKAKEEFSLYGSYVGLTDEDRSKISEYILNYIIGKEVVETTNVITLGDMTVNRDYNVIVPKLVDTVCELVKIGISDGQDVTINQPFIASFTKDYAGDGLFCSLKDDAFSHIESREYQSVLISTLENYERTLKELTLIFQYKNYHNKTNFLEKLKLNVMLYYHSANGDASLVGQKEMEISSGNYNIMSSLSELCFTSSNTSIYTNTVKLSDVAKLSTLSAEDKQSLATLEETQVTGYNTLRNYYKMEKSKYAKNYIGQINESAIVSPYLEIVFDIDKSAGFEYCYDFQFAFFYMND